MNLEHHRRTTMKQGLQRDTLRSSPLSQFEAWYKQINDWGLYEPSAMTLATVDANGQPWQRNVLLKLFDKKGFVFFTNYESRKAQHIASNAQVSLMFPWYIIGRQAIITGTAEKICTAESLAYFSTRPRGSQLGAWASGQSKAISSRSMLETIVSNMKKKFANNEIPLPPFWGGYRINPSSYEFWQARENRLHDRFLYTKSTNNQWDIERLAP